MKKITIGHQSFSKVLCGTNPFYGHSHFSTTRDAEYLARFDDRRIEQTIRECVRRGVNTVEPSANRRIVSILSTLQDASPQPIHLVGTTRIDETSDMKSHEEPPAEALVSDRESGRDLCDPLPIR